MAKIQLNITVNGLVLHASPAGLPGRNGKGLSELIGLSEHKKVLGKNDEALQQDFRHWRRGRFLPGNYVGFGWSADHDSTDRAIAGYPG
jgi:hypothetical protein